ncbi:MAG: type II toxin-antitoxin system RelE/ParE family toxin [Campylobacterales bacterium]
MPSIYKIVLDKKVIKDLKNIDKTWQKKIIQTIETTLTTQPYSGKKLVGNLSDYFRIRVGDYRIIYEIFDDIVTVEIIKIKHRKNIYK